MRSKKIVVYIVCNVKMQKAGAGYFVGAGLKPAPTLIAISHFIPEFL